LSAATPHEVPVVVVVPPRVLLLDVAGPIEVLRKANLCQDRIRFDVSYVAPVGMVSSSVGLEIAGLAPLPPALPTGSLVIVPGSADAPLGGHEASRKADAACEGVIVAWLARVVVPGTRLLSICAGALLAARAGLLDGHACTTHHGCTSELARLAPSARVLENRLYVDDGDRLTSAGITAGIDLMLHLVAQSIGHDCAIAIARYLVVYLRRGGGDPQLSPWLEGRNHIHPAVHRAQDAVAADPVRNWSVGELARVAGASARNLSRLFNEHTGMSVTDYTNRMRVALARQLLASSSLDMEAVAERSGFGSSRQLRRAWSRLHEAPPSRMREVDRAVRQ
jgi:transcriptional regulator GlxA family with amidase domain